LTSGPSDRLLAGADISPGHGHLAVILVLYGILFLQTPYGLCPAIHQRLKGGLIQSLHEALEVVPVHKADVGLQRAISQKAINRHDKNAFSSRC
jgi:hypothetical protein